MKREIHKVNHQKDSEYKAHTIYFENSRDEQFKVDTTAKYLDGVLDEINKMKNIRFIKKSQFNKKNKMVIDMTHPKDDNKVIAKLTTDVVL